MEVNIYTDGGSRGNPGSKFLGIKTNNEAEYSGIIAALEWVKKNQSAYQITQLNFFADSQLMIRQLQGVYKVKAPTLLPLFSRAQQLLLQINLPTKFTDVRREFNELADKLANKAMDNHF